MRVPAGPAARLTFAAVAGWLLQHASAQAFPLADPSNPSVVTTAPEPTDSDLRHQLQMHSGFAAQAGGGWTFVPQVSLQEVFTDNVFQSHSDRRWDLISILTPGFTLQGDMPNAQVSLSYGPEMSVYARTPSESRITQQLLGTGLFTIVPDEVFVDVRAVAGGSPVGTGFGAIGPGVTPSLTPQLNGFGTTGLSKQNQVQTSSLSITPYWLHRFGDTGTLRLGDELSQASYSQGNTFVPLLFPTGSNSVNTVNNDANLRFETGDRFAYFHDVITADATTGYGNAGTGHYSNYSILNHLDYPINRDVSVFGEIGYESINYGGNPPTVIKDAIWTLGGTWTPNPDSTISVSYGHRYGESNLTVDASYALTARTRLSASYTNGVQTQLQGLQGQLDQIAVNSLGQPVNARTGAPVILGNSAFGAQVGLFRTHTFTLTSATIWDRDQLTITFQLSNQTTLAQTTSTEFLALGLPAPPVGSTGQAKSAYVTWTHQLREDINLSSSAAYSSSRFTNGGGNEQSLSANVAMQYLLSQTLSAVASYSYYNLISSSPNQGYYQNLFLVGLTKQF